MMRSTSKGDRKRGMPWPFRGLTDDLLSPPELISSKLELVRPGLSWWYRRFAPADRELSQLLEAEARNSGRGLWTQKDPTPPWEWRRRGIPTVAGGVVGNLNSRIFHRPNCSAVTRLKESNRVIFSSAVDAEKAGFRNARDCR